MIENFSFLFRYLKNENIIIDQKEFDFQVQSHSDYPSLLAISDTLSFFKINNVAARVNNEELKNLPHNFIALIKDEKENSFLTFVEQNLNGFQYVQNGKTTKLNSKEFAEQFQNVVLVAEREETELNEVDSNKKMIFGLILLGLVYFFSISISNFSLLQFFIVFFASTGVYLSIEAISHEFGIKTKFSEAVCTISPNTDCNAVINSKKNRYFELISFSDSSITFFGAQLLALLFLSISNQLDSFYVITTVLLLLSVPIVLLSIYQQYFIIKKWCPICLTIIALIFTELGCLLFFNSFNLSLKLKAISYFVLAMTLSYLSTVFIKKIFKSNFDLQLKTLENYRFKRNYSLFKIALLDSKSIDYKESIVNNIVLGNKEAKLKVIIVLSPFCGHCKATVKIINEILERYRTKISIDIRFNFNSEYLDLKSLELHQRLINVFLEKGGDTFLEALNIWFEKKNIDNFEPIMDFSSRDFKIDKLLIDQFLWNKENNITFTPAIIINNLYFPNQYDRSDLIYFINDLEEDVEFYEKDKY
jgi:uncharacterized membrane protein